ncbi:hypothetical protein KY285_011305 [Solanum tuberosum]|nr:hypothetical protein KY285_011305 [Solanum tuberosum]
MTTRNVEVAEYASSDSFPPEFEQLGKLIALKCGGLPLAIVATAGLLSKSGKTLNVWRSVAENVS